MSAQAKEVLLWILGALALVALAGPAPNIATLLLVVLIAGIVLANWSIYAAYLPGSLGSATGGQKA
jgi:hypothetical protein